MPVRGLIGWNCVVPEHQRKGIGKAQIQEILRIFRQMRICRACVTTTNDDFFIPARRMYEACGFVEVRKIKGHNSEYEMEL